ncbi:hypothetical protein ACHAWF_008659 [Thalassiosira exigua]
MKLIASLILALGSSSVETFAPIASNSYGKFSSVCSSSARQMGLFDLFNAEARKEREERKEREIEEQERLQREIIARRSDPKKMEEYEAKVRVRRALRMNGEDDAADSVDMYSGEDEKIVGLN